MSELEPLAAFEVPAMDVGGDDEKDAQGKLSKEDAEGELSDDELPVFSSKTDRVESTLGSKSKVDETRQESRGVGFKSCAVEKP